MEVQTYCLMASGLCLFFFGALALIDVFAKKAAVQPTTKERDVPDLDKFAKVLEASSKLVDSISKAGPSLAALAASIIFAYIAALTIDKTAVPRVLKSGAERLQLETVGKPEKPLAEMKQ